VLVKVRESLRAKGDSAVIMEPIYTDLAHGGEREMSERYQLFFGER
jgi:hypothetical protein